jgi:hypothetical protein
MLIVSVMSSSKERNIGSRQQRYSTPLVNRGAALQISRWRLAPSNAPADSRYKVESRAGNYPICRSLEGGMIRGPSRCRKQISVQLLTADRLSAFFAADAGNGSANIAMVDYA